MAGEARVMYSSSAAGLWIVKYCKRGLRAGFGRMANGFWEGETTPDVMSVLRGEIG